MTVSRAATRHQGRNAALRVEVPSGILGSLGGFLRAISYAEVWVLDMSRDVALKGSALCQYAAHLTSRVPHLPDHPVFCCTPLAAEWSPSGDLTGARRYPASCQGGVYRVVVDADWDVRDPWSLCVRGKDVVYTGGEWVVKTTRQPRTRAAPSSWLCAAGSLASSPGGLTSV